MKKNKQISFFVLYCSFAGMMLLSSVGFAQYVAHEYQLIPTHGANDWKSFQIEDATYLALANYQNNATVEINSAIYKWVDNQFIMFQEIPTKGASDWEYFSIESEHFLAVANYKSQVAYEVNSTIYKWNGDSLVVFQEIPTSAAYDWEAFTMDDTIFLAVANQLDASGDFTANSMIYKWNGVQFDAIQSVLTHGASDWEAFNINDSLHFLAVANTYALTTDIFQWNGTEFENFQVLSSLGTTGIESFSMDNEYYLATSNGRDFSSFSTNSHIYKWEGGQFISYQQIPTVGAFDWEFFSINQEHFLCVANYQDDDDNYNLESVIYRWNGSSFVVLQEVFTNGATDWEFMEIANNYYLVVAAYKDGIEHNIDSKLYIFQEDNTFSDEINKEQASVLNLFPNPADNQFSLSINSVHPGLVTVEIIDIFGRLVHYQTVENTGDHFQIKVQLPPLESGLYYCSARLENKHYIQKLILR